MTEQLNGIVQDASTGEPYRKSEPFHDHTHDAP